MDVIPAVNQGELHPFFQYEATIKNMKGYVIQPEAWGPFAEGKHRILAHPVLSQIGEKYEKIVARAALRWNVKRCVAVIPKSVHKEKIEQNIDI